MDEPELQKDTDFDQPESRIDAAAQPRAVPEDEAPGAGQTGPPKNRTRKLMLYSIPLLALAVVASLCAFMFTDVFGDHPEPHNLRPITSITRPIPVPDYREMLDFLVLNEADGQKTLTLFRIELEFHHPKRYQAFKEHCVTFREMVYSFLLKQNSSRNTPRSWQVLVEKNLLDFVRLQLPDSRADNLKLVQVENL